MQFYTWLLRVIRRLATGPCQRANRIDNSAAYVMIEFLQPRLMLSTSPVGGEFRVNTTTEGNQETNSHSPYFPGGPQRSVAVDSVGDFVVTWESAGPSGSGVADQDGSGYGVYAQRYNSAGVSQGGEFRVNTTTTNDQRYSSIAMDATGDFAITWSSKGQVGDQFSYDVYAQRYNASGVAQGSEFRVNTTTTYSQQLSTVAMDPFGNFIIAWEDNGQDGSGYGVYAQRYDSAGAAIGGEFRVNTFTTNNQRYPTVAINTTGDFVVTWTSYTQDGSSGGVYAQRYNWGGEAQGNEFRVNTATASKQASSRVGMDAAGNFVVTWSSNSQDGSGYGVYAQRYNTSGIAQGSEFRVSGTTAGNQWRSAVAINATGDFVIAWESDDHSSDGVFAQLYNAAGATQGGQFIVNTYITGNQGYPSVAMDKAGNFVVTWDSGQPSIVGPGQDGSYYGVYAQRYLKSSDIVLAVSSGSTNYSENSPATAIDAGITISGAAGGSLATATVTLATFVVSQDVLSFTPLLATMGNIALTGNANGVLVLTSAGATATIAQWQSALRAITYFNSSDNPDVNPRSVTFVVNDGSSNSNSVIRTINVFPVNDVPVALASNVTTNEDTAKVFSVSDFLFNDVEGNSLVSITVNSQALASGDMLTVDQGVGAVAVTNGLTITAAQIPSLKYSPLANANGTARSTFSFKVNDAGLGTVSATMTINVTPVNDAPSVTTPTSANISSTAVTLGGNVTDDGGSPITERGVVFALTSSNPNPSIGGAGVTQVSATGTTGIFTVNVYNLTPAAAYSYFAYATNEIGTTYTSPVSTFTTRSAEPPVVTAVYDSTGSSVVHNADILMHSVTSLSVVFSETMNVVPGGASSVTNPSNWRLTRYGIDVTNQISGITFALNPTTLQYVAVVAFAQPLFQGGYQLVARQTIQDATGRTLDGDGDGVPGGDFRINFYVAATVGNTTDIGPWLYQIEDINTPLNAPAPLFTPVTSSLLVFDADSNNWTGATIQIAINYQSSEDVLGFVNTATPKITGSWNATTGTLTLSGTDTVSNYRTALRNVTYHNTSLTPNTAVTRTVDFQTTDGLLPSNVVSRNVTVIGSSIPAVISGVNGTGTFFQGDPALTLAANLVISAPNIVNLASATVSFTNWQGEDRLDFNNIFALQHSFSQDLVAHTATFTITGSDLVDHYQTLLRSVIYWDVSGAPVTSARVASFSVSDGLSTSNIVTRNTIVTAVNQRPTLTAIESTPLFYKANDPAFPAQPISATLLAGDPDSNNLTKATVQITSGYQNDANGNDVLAFTNQLGITGSFNAATGTLTLSGSSGVGNYRTALRSVTFSTSGSAVSTANRTLTIIATDDATPTPANSLSATRSVTVSTTNTPPALTGVPTGALAYVRGAAAAALGPNAIVSDADSINLTGAAIQVIANYQNGQDILAATSGSGITVSFDAASGTLTLSGTSSLANYQTVLRSVTYKTNTSAASTLTRTIGFTLNDGLAPGSTVIRNVTLS